MGLQGVSKAFQRISGAFQGCARNLRGSNARSIEFQTHFRGVPRVKDVQECSTGFQGVSDECHDCFRASKVSEAFHDISEVSNCDPKWFPGRPRGVP